MKKLPTMINKVNAFFRKTFIGGTIRFYNSKDKELVRMYIWSIRTDFKYMIEHGLVKKSGIPEYAVVYSKYNKPLVRYEVDASPGNIVFDRLSFNKGDGITADNIYYGGVQ